MIEQLTRDDFARQLNTKFLYKWDDFGEVVFELIVVTEIQHSPQQEVFSLLFKGPPDQLLPQQMYSLVHEQLGALDIFLVPIRQDAEGIYYEAVFNRFIPG